MVSIEIDLDGESKLYEFPTSWSEITVNIYKKIHELPKPEDENNLMYLFDIINTLSGIDKTILYQMNIEQFQLISEQLKFIYTPVEVISVDNVEIDGEIYYLHTDYDRYTAGEIITIETLLKQTNHDYIKCMTDLLCIFLRKKKDDKIELFTTDLFKRKEIFEKLNISQVNNVFSFFLTGGSSLETTTKDSTNNQSAKTIVSSKND